MMLVRPASRPTMGAVESALWPTTGDLDTETASLSLQIEQLGRDIFNAFGGLDTSGADWDQFSSGWRTFLDDFRQWRDAGWFWNPTRRDQLLGYRTTFNAMLAQAKRLGVGTLAAPQKDEGDDPLSKFLGTLTTVVIVAGVAVGAYYGAKIIKE
jgi:hypothetical protein